jgi:hypothetical protein
MIKKKVREREKEREGRSQINEKKNPPKVATEQQPNEALSV